MLKYTTTKNKPSPKAPSDAHPPGSGKNAFSAGFTIQAKENTRFCAAENTLLHNFHQATCPIRHMVSSGKILRIKVTLYLHLTYNKNGGNLGLVLKMKNIACLSILLTKYVKYTYLYLFKFVLYSMAAFKAN